MAERTPLHRVKETIDAVAVIQAQLAGLAEALQKLTSRVEALEGARPPASRQR